MLSCVYSIWQCMRKEVDMIKAGDTIWTIDGEWIQNFDDDYYAIKIPTHVMQHTVKEYYVDNGYGFPRHYATTTEERRYENNEYKTEYYLTKDEAIEALQEERKRFVTDKPNNWWSIIKELQRLLEEQEQ